MAGFLSDQLDFIFFFYGLAFILLGATCWAIARRPPRDRSWTMLAGFGFVHGAGEWLDLSALLFGDSPSFAAIRMVGMTISFVFLTEFARLQAAGMGHRVPGRWAYLPILFGIGAVALWAGTLPAGIAARYSFGLFGSLAASVMFVRRADALSARGKSYALAASVGFALYGLSAGAIVPAASFWPASVLNYPAFAALTGMPVQLVRGFLACWIAFSAWAIWGQRLSSDVSSNSFAEYLRKQLIWTAVAMSTILVAGWTLTEWLGGIYRHNVQLEASGDIDLLASRLAGETRAVEALVKTLAGARPVQELLADPLSAPLVEARSALGLHIEAGGAQAGYITNGEGTVLASSGPSAQELQGLLVRSFRSVAKHTSAFVFEPGSGTTFFARSQPVLAGDRTVGAATLVTSVQGFSSDLEHFDRPYFFIDPNGVVVMTNVPDSLRRTLWPVENDLLLELGSRFGKLDLRPISIRQIEDGVWTQLDGEREYVRRRFIGADGWSLIILKPTREIFATRFVGIIITLLVTVMTVIYLLGRERWMHEEAQRAAQAKLHDLAREMSVKATTDALTGLHNRLALNDFLPRELARADRRESPISVVLYDIDNFKKVNDRFGHATGDEVLAASSRTVSGLVRPADRVVRWGGEEFLIVLPDTNVEAACQVAEKLRGALAAMMVAEVSVTCSFGVAQYASGEAMSDLIARADRALYAAKAAGRNRVELAQPARGPRQVVAA
ncbi:diguanylate cyclase [uncultured Enterovirga sp.]|uniref:sensor domain-containing diguanylate cyclase n=1 Tax=uncultured Enterovirga sp. TaxID=2026352 RepID=UPI0035C9980A